MATELTLILNRLSEGDHKAAADLFSVVYAELRSRAALYMSQERKDHTLQPTALVHEAFVRLIDGQPVEFQGRTHFYNAASEAMRRVLVDHARIKSALKRGGAKQRVDLQDANPVASSDDDFFDLEALDNALNKLKVEDERAYQVVMHRYFAGLTEVETAQVLGLSIKTVQRDWMAAKVFLLTLMKAQSDGG